MGVKIMVQKLRSGLAKTRESLFGKIQHLVLGKTKIDDDLLVQLEEAMIGADVGVDTTMKIISRIKKRVEEERYESTDELMHLLRDEVAALLSVGGPKKEGGLIPSQPRPYVVLIVGVNGVGKTTTVGKLAARLKQEGFRVVVGAADTFRVAANEQLEIWASRAGVDLIQQDRGSDPASVAFDTLSSAISKHADVVLIDTAGRLHTKVNLMEEMGKIRRVLGKKMPGAPHEVLLVLDAGTGQNGLHQVKLFMEATGVTGIVLTKLDGTAKGGIVLAISNELSVPVKYIGVGEQLDDLQPFEREAFVEALFDKSDHAVTRS